METDPLVKGIYMLLLRYSDVIGLLPWTTIKRLTIQATRWQDLPTVAFRAINAGYTESSGTFEQVQEGLAILGGDVQLDRIFDLVAEETIEDPRITQTKMKIKAAAYAFNNAFINGDPLVDPDSFAGLRRRIGVDLPARCTINLATAGDCLKVFANADNQFTFLDALHEADKVVGGADAFFMNEDTYLRISSLLRRQALLDVTQDQYERTINKFNNGRLVDIGLLADRVTQIITSTEDPGDGGNDSTSLYACRFGKADGSIETGDEGLHGIQLEPLQVYDPLSGGEMEAAPAKLLRIDWPVSIAILGDDYCIARVQGFRMRAA